MSELKEKKFGYVVHPPHGPCHPAFPGPIPPGIHTQDWLAYINSYIDVRARQMYEKLKGLANPVTPTTDNSIRDYLLLKEKDSNRVHMVWIENGTLRSGYCGTYDEVSGELSRAVEIDIPNV